MYLKLLKNIVIYGAANGIVALSPLLLLPILTELLTPEEYGIYSNFLLMIGILTVIIGAGTNGAIAVNFHKLNLEEFESLFFNSLYMLMINAVIVFVLLFLLSTLVSNSLQLKEEFVLLAFLAASVNCINLIALALFQTSDNPLKYLIVKVVQTATDVGLTLYFMLHLKDGLLGRLESNTLSFVITLFLCVIFVSRIISFKFTIQKGQIVKLMKFGYPLLPHAIAGLSVMFVGRLSLTEFNGPDATGIFMVSLQISMILMLFIEPINKAFAPWLFKQLGTATDITKVQIIRFTYGYYFMLVILLVSIVLLVDTIFAVLVDPEYQEAKVYVVYLGCGFLFQGMYYSVTNYIIFTERTHILSISTVSSCTIGAACSILLTAFYGTLGAAIGFTITNLLLFLFALHNAQKVYPMPWLKSLKRDYV